MNPKKHSCGVELVKINGRTLRGALKASGAEHRFGSIRAAEWVEVCPKCNANVLLPSTGMFLPFLCADGAMCTVADLNQNKEAFDYRALRFCSLIMSTRALTSAIALAKKEDPSTAQVEARGATIRQHSDVEDSLEFSEAVCVWGRGQRVWANLIRRNGE